ncbi:aldose epimerase family protein [Enterococcus massiliensis]|uniref:aldose epimerase family protein n=1 Tax=Enterococcus massiliensis TaxID=1640685 RepID=UPI00065DE057|nr:aldose epimerase family protein [Enterococcus massiliensis]
MVRVKKQTNETYGTYFLIENTHGVKLAISPQGARALEWIVPVEGQERDLLVGFKTIEEHKKARYYAATIGPVAGRIAGAAYTIDGKTYQTPDNDGGNTLHGGFEGYDTQMWSAEPFEEADNVGVVFSLTYPDGKDGFPGNVTSKITYRLDNDNNYQIEYVATTDKPTIYNPTNHGYYNLTGSPANSINEHTLQVGAKQVAETNPDVTTTGKKVDVAGTKFDFVAGRKIGNTYLDDPFLLDHEAANDLVLTSPDEKVRLEIQTTASAVVIYTTGSSEAGTSMKHGEMVDHGGIAIEPQEVPGTEKYPQFGNIVLRPEQPFYSKTTYHVVF